MTGKTKKIPLGKLRSVIELCDPKATAMRFRSKGRCKNEGLFRFCQHLKDYCSTVEEALPYIRQWFKRWSSVLIDDTGYNSSVDDVEVQAIDLWPRIKHSVGGQLAEAIRKAESNIDYSIPGLENYGGQSERMLAAVCYELQQIAGNDANMWISERDAAEVLGLDRERGRDRARTTLRVFMRKGILSFAEKGNKFRSTRFRYMGKCPIPQKFGL